MASAEQEGGVTMECTTYELYTGKLHYTSIDAPGHRDYIINEIAGALQAEVALIMMPADGKFTRLHSCLIHLLGVIQFCIGVNIMDCDTAGYTMDRFDENFNELKIMLIRVGWTKNFIVKYAPRLPVSGCRGDYLMHKSVNMKEGQNDISYITGECMAAVSSSPFLDTLRNWDSKYG
jgi:elongation factor 1-alpha